MVEENTGEKLRYNEFMEKMRTNPQADNGLGQIFTCKSKDKLYYRTWLSEEPKSILVGIHGMAGHGEYYVQVADQMINNNITTYALDLKHHGRSSGKKGDIQNFEILIKQINEFITFIKRKHKDLPIFLMGISMGGCISINYAVMFPDTITGIILMAPAVKSNFKVGLKDGIRVVGLIIAYPFVKGKPVIDIQKRRGEVGTRNPLRSQYDESDEYSLKKVSMRYLLQLRKWLKKAFKNAKKISMSVLIVQGTNDKLVSPKGVQQFFDNLTVKDKKFVELKDAYHCLYSDPAMVEEGGWEAIKGWILSH